MRTAATVTRKAVPLLHAPISSSSLMIRLTRATVVVEPGLASKASCVSSGAFGEERTWKGGCAIHFLSGSYGIDVVWHCWVSQRGGVEGRGVL